FRGVPCRAGRTTRGDAARESAPRGLRAGADTAVRRPRFFICTRDVRVLREVSTDSLLRRAERNCAKYTERPSVLLSIAVAVVVPETSSALPGMRTGKSACAFPVFRRGDHRDDTASAQGGCRRTAPKEI